MGAGSLPKLFTKQSFSGFVSADHLRQFYIGGRGNLMKRRPVRGKNIILAASVSYPQTDLYIPFSITINS